MPGLQLIRGSAPHVLAGLERPDAIFIGGGVTREGVVVTGTGTDCIALACPTVGDADPHAGLHTAVGEAIGHAVLDATRAGVAGWLADAAAPDFWSATP